MISTDEFLMNTLKNAKFYPKKKYHEEYVKALNFLRAVVGGYMSMVDLEGKIPRPIWVDLIYLSDEINALVKKGLKQGIKI